VVEDEAAAFQYVRDYLSFLPDNTFDDAPVVNPGLEPEITPSDLELDSIVPDADNTAYDMHEILLRIFDDGDVFEIADQRGPAMITAFARVDGRTVGVIANQPMFMSGAVDNEASDKASSFIRFCDSYNLPLVFVVDTPGAMPGVEQEKGGIIKRGGRFFNAIVEADVPKVTIIVRKAYGGGYAVMGSKQLSADLNYAWPTARIAVIGADGAAQLLMKRFPDPTTPEAQQIKKDFIDGYNLNIAIPWIAAERGYIDGVIEPHETRLLLRKSLHILRDKQIHWRTQRKHGLTPI
jgi:acetyl-CoA carboxylase carboxyltransferase component